MLAAMANFRAGSLRQTGIDLKPMLRLAATFMRPYKKVVVALSLLMAAEAALNSGLTYFMKVVVNTLFATQRAPDMVILVPTALFGIIALKAGVSYASNILLARVGHGIVNDVQVEMFNKITRCDLAQLNAMHSGQFASRFLNDAVLMRESIMRSVQGIAREVLTIVGMGVVMFILDWTLALILCSVLPLTALFTLNLGNKTNKAAASSPQRTSSFMVGSIAWRESLSKASAPRKIASHHLGEALPSRLPGVPSRNEGPRDGRTRHRPLQARTEIPRGAGIRLNH